VTAAREARVAINALPLLLPRTGIGQYAYHIIRGMQARLARAPALFYGYDWDEAIRRPAPPEPPTLVQQFKQRMPFGYELARFLQQRAFDARVKRERFDLYHEPNFLAQRFEGPTVVTVHDLSWVRHPETHPVERVRAMDKTMPRVAREATLLVADSESTRRDVLSHYGVAPDRVRTVLLGVTDEFMPMDPARTRSALDRLGLVHGEYVLAVGTLEPRKNLATAIAAYAALPERLQARHPLAIAGMQGWGDQALSPQAAALVARGRVRLVGFVPQEDLPAVYAGARVFVYPSLYEGFGLPPLEAMACGTAVIVSNRSSLPEVVGDAGRQVDALDVEGLAAQLRELLEDDALRARLGQAGRERSRQFTWDRCIDETLAVYGEALART
jgi:glycosyltransferase involved in cell wall biosynthesis